MTMNNVVKRYFSGLECTVHFESIYVDEIVNIQYQLNENVLPLFSYTSYTYKIAVRGNRIVQGSFTANRTNRGTINRVLEMVLGVGPISTGVPEDVQQTLALPNPVSPVGTELPATTDYTQITDILSSTEAARRSEFGWNAPSIPNTSRIGRGQLRSANSPFLGRTGGEFNIYVKMLVKEFDYDVKTLKQTITEGFTVPCDPLPGLIDTLVGVQITGVGTAIDDSGKNIVDVYNFIARDLVTTTINPSNI